MKCLLQHSILTTYAIELYRERCGLAGVKQRLCVKRQGTLHGSGKITACRRA